MEKDIYRGDIFYIDYGQYTGSEQRAGRPGIIVSNDMNNTYSDTVEVVYLTTKPKEDLPTHVPIRSTSRVSTALCEQITTVSKERIGNYVASLSESEMLAIDKAILISLQIEFPGVEKKQENAIPYNEEKNEPQKDEPSVELGNISRVIAEREIYKELYESLLSRLIESKQ